MAELLQRVALLSLTTSAVLLPLLLLTRRLQGRYAARSLYVLWLLLAVRLLLPVEIQLPRPVVTIETPVYLEAPAAEPEPPVLPAAPQVQVPQAAHPPVPAREPVRPKLAPMEWAALLWLAGTALFLAWNGLTYLAARRRLLAGARIEEGDRALAQSLEPGCRVPVRRSAEARTPMTLGLLRPVVLLPLDCGTEEELRLVLRHELCHVRRLDLWYKALMGLVNAVHWFNPLVWVMARTAGRNLEYCCDDAVVAGQDRAYRRRYGEVLLRHAAAECRTSAFATRFGGGGQMKGRLMNLFADKKRGAAMVSLVLCAALLSGGLVACESAEAAGKPAAAPDVPRATEKLYDAWQDQDLGIALNQIPAAWEGNYRVETTREQEADFVEFYREGGGELLFVLQITDVGTWESAQFTIGRTPMDLGIRELGERDGKVCLLGWPTPAEGDDEAYASMLGDVPAIGDNFAFLSAEGWTWPLPGEDRITQRFAPITGAYGGHTGVDVAVDEGTPVLAARDGTVAAAGFDETRGNYVELSHEGDQSTLYGQLSEVQVQAGDRVQAGAAVGLAGATGAATGPHLHLEYRKGGVRQDPLALFPDLTFDDSAIQSQAQPAPESSAVPAPAGAGGQQDPAYAWPMPGCYTVTTKFGAYADCGHGKGVYHTGIDVEAPVGTEVLSWRAGKVVASGRDAGYGEYVEVLHTYGDGTDVATGEGMNSTTDPGDLTRYANLSTRAVQVGDIVEQGQALGTVGGFLHLEYQIGEDYWDPEYASFWATPLADVEAKPVGGEPYRDLTEIAASTSRGASGPQLYGTGTDGKRYQVDVRTGTAVEVEPRGTGDITMRVTGGDTYYYQEPGTGTWTSGPVDQEPPVKNAFGFKDLQVDLKDGAAPAHSVGNGYMATYSNDGGTWALKAGDTVTIATDTLRREGNPNGMSASWGYVLDGAYTEAEHVKLVGEQIVTITVPEDGAYRFTLLASSIGAIEVARMDLTVD